MSVTVSIPKTLYNKIKELCKKVECDDVESLIVTLLREKVAEVEEELSSIGVSEEEKHEIVQRLKKLGYL